MLIKIIKKIVTSKDSKVVYTPFTYYDKINSYAWGTKK